MLTNSKYWNTKIPLFGLILIDSTLSLSGIFHKNLDFDVYGIHFIVNKLWSLIIFKKYDLSTCYKFCQVWTLQKFSLLTKNFLMFQFFKLFTAVNLVTLSCPWNYTEFYSNFEKYKYAVLSIVIIIRIIEDVYLNTII